MNTEIIVAVLASPLLVKIVDAVIGMIKKNRTPLEEAVFFMLQDRLEFLINKAIDRGHTTTIELKKLRGFLTAYERLDGDDYIHDMWEIYKDLPIE